MLKKEARTIFRQKRMALTDREKIILNDLLLIEFQKLSFPFFSSILSYYPLEQSKEPDTFMLTRYLRFKNPGLLIAYPKTNNSDHSMQAIVCDDDHVFEKNNFFIHEPTHLEYIEPEKIDMVLVPLLAFDSKGYRVGYGKGFYDRFLKQCRNDCVKIGLSYFEPIDAINDAGEFDVPLDFCITPQKAYVF